MIDPITAILGLGKTALERLMPDPEKRALEFRRLQELAQQKDLANLNAEVSLLVAQLEVNKTEAGHKSVFVAGWRPFIGWVGGLAMAYQFVLYPLMIWAAAIFGSPEFDAPPVLDSGALFSIVTAMLGIGSMRSYDKKNRTETNRIKQDARS